MHYFGDELSTIGNRILFIFKLVCFVLGDREHRVYMKKKTEVFLKTAYRNLHAHFENNVVPLVYYEGYLPQRSVMKYFKRV